MSAREPSVAERPGVALPRRLRVALWVSAAAVGVGVGLAAGMHQTSQRAAAPADVAAAANGPGATWPAGAEPAPGFTLADESGEPVSLAAFRGRPVIVTFIDPLCRDLCPTEAKVLAEAVHSLPGPARPAILAVSVNQWGNAPAHLRRDDAKWSLPGEWHWAVGKPAELRRVWSGYHVAVQDDPKTVTGITVHDITHTEAAYVVDGGGYQRALFVWPYTAKDMAAAVRAVAG